jgi:signal transduction histidine kinase
LKELLAETAVGWRQAAAIRDMQFQVQLEPNEATIMGDESAIRRALDILLDNAFKYTPAGGEVRLTLELFAGKAVISVQDNGIGIAKAEQTRIFERFYRVDKARSREFGGVGLGLAIAQWIITQHQGTIKVESELERGSVFKMELLFVEKPLQMRPAMESKYIAV